MESFYFSKTDAYEPRIVIDSTLLLRQSDKADCITSMFKKSKVSGTRKLTNRILEKFSGISRKEVHKNMKRLPERQQIRQVFDNRAPPRPILASKIHKRHQIDVVDFEHK